MSMISKVSGYAPGWMEDYGTVASALHSNYQSVRGFSVGDLTVGMTYLWDDERNQRKAAKPDPRDLKEGYPGTCGALQKDEADDFRRLCIAVDASYLTDRNELAAALKTIGHEIHDAVQKSTFQEPAFFVSESQARNEVFFVIRGTASMKDALTDGDCAAEDLNSALPEFAGVKAHRGMAKSAHALLDKHASKILKCVEMFELKKKKPRFVVLGHSLGAGTAAIASILLKERLGKTPVECVAFATPPCLDVKGCVASAAHLKSIVCHDDVVVRASRQNVDDLFSRIQQINWKEDFSKDLNKRHTVQAAKAASVTLASMQKSAASAAASFAEQAKRRLASSTQGKGNKNVEAAKAAAGAAASVAAAGAAKAAAGASALAGKFSSMMSKKASAPDADNAKEEASEPADLVDLFVPGKIYHFRRSPRGAGTYASVIRHDAPTLARIELSSSYVEDHTLVEYKEALDTFSCQMNNVGVRMAPEVEGALEIYDGYAPDYGVGSWKEAPGCFIMPHELCLKRPDKEGELMPLKTELGGGGYVAEKYEFKSKGPWGIKIEVKSDDKKAKTLRLYVPGGEAEHVKWLAAIQRCCDGVLGAPAPPDVTEKEVAKPKKSFVFGGHSFF